MQLDRTNLLLIALILWLAFAGEGGGIGPSPEPAPFPARGLAVLMVYESEKADDLTKGQRAILYGREMREFLNAKCVKGPDGTTPEYRVWDKDTDASDDAETWQKAMAVPRQADRWLVVSNGTSGYSGPLPEQPEEFKAIVNRFASSQ